MITIKKYIACTFLLTACTAQASRNINSKLHALRDEIDKIKKNPTDNLQEAINALNQKLNTIERECKENNMYNFQKTSISQIREKIQLLSSSPKKSKKNKNTDASTKRKSIYTLQDLTPNESSRQNADDSKGDFWETLSNFVLIGTAILVVIGIVQFLYSAFTSKKEKHKPSQRSTA